MYLMNFYQPHPINFDYQIFFTKLLPLSILSSSLLSLQQIRLT